MAEGKGGTYDQAPQEPRWKHEDLQYKDGHIALRVHGERGTKFRFGHTKFKYDPGVHHDQDAIVRTKSGDEYYIAHDQMGPSWGKFIVNIGETRKQHRLVAAYATDLKSQVPPLEFGKPWEIPSFHSTPDVQDMLLQYKIGAPGLPGYTQVEGTNPFDQYASLLAGYHDQAERLSATASGLPSTEHRTQQTSQQGVDPKPWWRRMF